MKKFIVALLLITSLGFAQSKTGTSGSVFLKVSLIPRGSGMGGAYVAVANDASSVFWNPAGLAHVKTKAVFASYTNWVAQTIIPAFNYAMPIPGLGTVGIFASALQSSGFQEVKIYPDGTIEETGKTFAYNAVQAGISYSQFLTDRFATGVNLKMIYEGYGPYSSAKSVALDAGTVFYTGLQSLRVAMSLQNLGPDMQPAGEYDLYLMQGSDIVTEKRTFRAYKLPMTFRIGLAMELIDNPTQRLTVSVEGANANDADEIISVGFEFQYLDMLVLRAGRAFNKSEGGYGAGVGFHTSRFSLDYSFSDFGALPDIHRISVNFSL